MGFVRGWVLREDIFFYIYIKSFSFRIFIPFKFPNLHTKFSIISRAVLGISKTKDPGLHSEFLRRSGTSFANAGIYGLYEIVIYVPSLDHMWWRLP